MRAALLTALRQIELRHLKPEPLKTGEIRLAVRVALTDGTDVKAYRRGHPHMPMPCRFGHEFSGVVLEVGSGASQWVVGDRVACVHSAPCGQCYWCELGQAELCETLGDRLLLGAYADQIILPAEIVAQNTYRCPDELSFEAAAFLEPLACVLHTWAGVLIHPQMSVAIFGLGGFSLLHAMVARQLGVSTIFLIGRNPVALARAQKFGLAEVINVHEVDAERAITERTGGRGADRVIECTGAREIWEAAPRLCRRGGTVILFGGLPPGSQVCFDATRLHYDEVQIQSPYHFTPKAVRWAFELLTSTTLDPRPLITGFYPLSHIAAAFEELDTGTQLKLAIYPNMTLP